MKTIDNPYFRGAKKIDVADAVPHPSVDEKSPMALLADCPAHSQTPFVEIPDLASDCAIARVFVKDETARMGLGSFKALGAAYVIAHEAAQSGKEPVSEALTGRAYVTASAGNHGLSVAAGARLFGARAVIYLSKTVPDAFADRLRQKGAEVRIEGDDYDASMKAAQLAADAEAMTLLSDSSWQDYYELPHRLMEGYLVSAHEMVEQMPSPPTHVFLQAGVGGLAGAMAAYFRKAWGETPVIVVVEPEVAPALQASIEAGRSVYTDGPVSNMGRLDCKEPSLIALKGLARDANHFVTVSDETATKAVERLAALGISSTPSGVGGLAGLLAADKDAIGLEGDSVALVIVSEGDDA